MKTIQNLAFSNDKKNGSRSILIIISIVLTTMLLTIIAAYSYGTIQLNKKNAGILYGNFYGMYRGISAEQIQEMQMHSVFTKIGETAYAGEIENKERLSLFWVDETARKMLNLDTQLVAGRNPGTVNEIAATKGFFRTLGVKDPKIGDSVILNSRSDQKKKYTTKKFVICGFLKEIKAQGRVNGYTGYVSRKFYEQEVSQRERYYSVYFNLAENLGIHYENATEKMQNLAVECGIDAKKAQANTDYIMWQTDPGIENMVTGGVLMFCVILFSVVVIYNIFQVGVTQKIQEYGKIKALGATKRQLKKIVFLEGMLLAVIGIPIGLLLGCGIGKLVFSWISDLGNQVYQGVTLARVNILYPPILIGVVVITFLTVWLALRKPMKTVAGISPVEAMRFQGQSNRKRNIRKGKKNIGVKEMAMASLSGDWKRTIGTIITMGLSCVLFIAFASFAGNMDTEYEARRDVEYGKFYLSLDYSKNDEAYPENNLDAILKKNPLGKQTIEKIKKIDGVTEVKVRKQLVMKKLDRYGKVKKGMDAVLVYDKDSLKKSMEQYDFIGTLDYEKVADEDGLIYGWSHFMEEGGYYVGQTLNVRLEDGVSQKTWKGMLLGAVGKAESDWILTEKTYQKLGMKGARVGEIWVDCKKEDEEKVQQALEEILASKEHVEMKTYEEAYVLAESSMKMMKMLCYSLVIILGLIGFMNMANTIIISIVTRKQEFGMLQAIGMTNRQLNQMLSMEGMVFTVGTMAGAMILGIPAGFALFQFGKKESWFGLWEYHFPWKEVFFMVVAIAGLQMLLSFILSRNIRKESVVERIRY